MDKLQYGFKDRTMVEYLNKSQKKINEIIENINYLENLDYTNSNSKLNKVENQCNINTEDLEIVNDLLDDKNVKIYVGPKGTGNGNAPTSPTNLQNAFNMLMDRHKKLGYLQGEYTIQLNEGIYTGEDTYCTLQNITSENPIIIEGFGTVIFDGECLDKPYKHAIYIVNCNTVLKNITFSNFRVTPIEQPINYMGTRNGVAISGGKCHCININANNCDWCGIFAHNNARLNTTNCLIDNCRQGIGVTGGQISIGLNESLESRSIITNCVEGGIYLSGGVTGHTDYTLIKDCTTGLYVGYACDTNSVKMRLENCNIGIIVDNGGYAYDTDIAYVNNNANIQCFNGGGVKNYYGLGNEISRFVINKSKQINLNTVVNNGEGNKELFTEVIYGGMYSGLKRSFNINLKGRYYAPSSGAIQFFCNDTLLWQYKETKNPEVIYEIDIDFNIFNNTTQILFVKTIFGDSYKIEKVNVNCDMKINNTFKILSVTDTGNRIIMDKGQITYQGY